MKPPRPAQTPTWFCSEVVGWIGVLKKGKRAAAVGGAPEGAPQGHVGSLLFRGILDCGSRGNDPSAGSPTETLLRLHLPLNDEI